MRAGVKQKPAKMLDLLPPGGMVTTQEPWVLPPGKNAWVNNLRVLATISGDAIIRQHVTRDGTSRVSSQALPNDETVRAHLRHDGVDYLASDDNVYYLDGSQVPQLIGAVARAPRKRGGLVAFAGLVIVLDGEYAKSVDPSDSYAYATLYDVDGYMFDWINGTVAGSWSLYAGATIRAGFKATTPAWGVGSIPQTKARLYLGKVGSPTGNVTIKVFSSDGSTLLGSGTVDASTLGTSATIQTVTITAAAGQSLSIAQSTDIYGVAEYDSGDAANYVFLPYAAVSSGGKAQTYNGSWAADTAKNPLMTLGAGLPPKASVGSVKDERLRLGGGNWSDNGDKSKLHYCDVHDAFSWGSREYQGGSAGYWGVGRDDGGEIAAIINYFEDTYIFKIGEKSIHRLTGVNPASDWELKEIFPEEGAAAADAVCETGNNILYLDQEVLGLEGVEGYGDVRKFPKSRDVQNLIDSYGDASAFAVYNRRHDQYWLQLDVLGYTLVMHVLTKDWVAYTWAGLNPTCFSHHDGITFIGSGGYLYRLDESVVGADGYVDENNTGTQWEADKRGPMLDWGAPDQDKHFKRITWQISARLGATGSFTFRRDYATTDEAKLTKTFGIAPASDVSVGEMDWTVGEWDWPVGGGGQRVSGNKFNNTAKLLQVGVSVNPAGDNAYFGPVRFPAAILGSS